MSRLSRLGLQRRIMAYVLVGLSVMFGSVAFLGLRAIDRATQLVYEQRLAIAHSTAAILESEFARMAATVRQTRQAWLDGDAARSANELLRQLSLTETSSFVEVQGVSLMDARSRLRAAAGRVEAFAEAPASGDLRPGEFRVLPPVSNGPQFGALVIPLRDGNGSAIRQVLVHLGSANRASPYVPSDPGAVGDGEGQGEQLNYQLEVISNSGTSVLAIGPHEEAGEVSRHLPAVRELIARRESATLLHEAGEATAPEDHVMAIVPIRFSPYSLILEQPQDVALALPLQLRQELIAAIGLGFVAVLVVAWVTTRHVVKPTEQLTAAAQRMAAGDLTSPVVVSAEDEIGTLADSLETMRRRLNDAYSAVERTNRALESRVAERTARLGRVLQTTITAQEDERHRLARELHDETAQTLAALLIALDRARDELSAARSDTVLYIHEARDIASRALAETRRLILGLRPAVLDDLGLVAAIRWQVDQLFDPQSFTISITATGLSQRLPGHLEVTLFRVVQEAITNVARHAHAKHLDISLLRRGDLLLVEVSDAGRGFDIDRLDASGREHVGVLGMRERVALIGGKLTLRSQPGQGTTVTIEVPIGEAVGALGGDAR